MAISCSAVVVSFFLLLLRTILKLAGENIGDLGTDSPDYKLVERQRNELVRNIQEAQEAVNWSLDKTKQLNHAAELEGSQKMNAADCAPTAQVPHFDEDSDVLIDGIDSCHQRQDVDRSGKENVALQKQTKDRNNLSDSTVDELNEFQEIGER